MSLDNIQLTPALLQNLYRNSLVNLERGEEKAGLAQKSTLPFLGKNAKKVMIATSSKDHAYLAENELEMLINMLSACGLALEDVAILNTANNAAATYDVILQELTPAKLLFFGVKPSSLDFPLEIPLYKIQKFNGMNLLSSASFSELQSNKDEKVKLWKSLQELFKNA